ncbi:hypothetical protein [uncultured Coprobacter sp.]|uniref:hypothetical protein n=1 Tax=uncultured Coprobacter sp. TaxID=1720550 RepID=UPI0026101C0F|nr:hypothetical protein [uncultured Coprobacter sp.]
MIGNETIFEFADDGIESEDELFEIEVEQSDNDGLTIMDVDMSNDLVQLPYTLIKSISIDGENVPPDENLNVDLKIGLAEIRSQLADYTNNKTVALPFQTIDFVQSGKQFKLTFPIERHNRGYNAVVEGVVKQVDTDYQNVIYQSYILPNATLVVVADEIFNGIAYIKGVSQNGDNT